MSRATTQQFDRDLVQRLQERDPNAMLELYDQYSRLLFSIILRAVRNPAVAEDITQEAFLRIWNRIASFDASKGNLEGWMVTVARNQAFDYLRSVRKLPEQSRLSLAELEQAAAYPVGTASTSSLDMTQAAESALNGLNPEQRQVMELTHFEGMSQTEIAGRMNKPLGTVKGLVRSALKSLRSSLAATGAQREGGQTSPAQQQVSNDV